MTNPTRLILAVSSLLFSFNTFGWYQIKYSKADSLILDSTALIKKIKTPAHQYSFKKWKSNSIYYLKFDILKAEKIHFGFELMHHSINNTESKRRLSGNWNFTLEAGTYLYSLDSKLLAKGKYSCWISPALEPPFFYIYNFY